MEGREETGTRALLHLMKRRQETDLDTLAPVDTAECLREMQGLKPAFENCPESYAPLCAESEKAIAQQIRYCQTINASIREECLRVLKEEGFSGFRRCTTIRTRTAEVKIVDTVNRLTSRAERVTGGPSAI